MLRKNQVNIKKSTISKAGLGAFTKKDIPKGAVIGWYKGKVLSQAQYDALSEKSPRLDYIFEVDAWGPKNKKTGKRKKVFKYIDASRPQWGNWTRFLNSQKGRKENVEAFQKRRGGKLYLLAVKNIPAGGELFYDYGSSYFGL